MTRYELSLSPDYVPGWSIVDAVRELFQNGLDQETLNPNNKMFFDYDESKHLLRIGNKESVLESATMLLGHSSKRGDKATIGQFGEGYKIAALVLCRMDKTFRVLNYAKREVWHGKIIKSRKYDSNLLVFDIDKKFFWQSVPDHDLVIEVGRVTPEEYADIVARNLHLQDEPDNVVNVPMGRILMDERFQGHMYVNGLYICRLDDLVYGYDVLPQHIVLDRDRRLINGFDAQWITSQMWRDSNLPEAVELLQKGAPDVNYFVNSCTSTSSFGEQTLQLALQMFERRYGTDTMPVSTQAEIDYYGRVGIKTAVVPSPFKRVLDLTERVTSMAASATEIDSPYEVMLQLVLEISPYLSTSIKDKLQQVLEVSKSWKNNLDM